MNYEYSAGIVPYYKQGKTIHYLLLHYESGHWDFPKGHIEKDESKIEAAQRELYEETGIQGCTLIANFEYSFEYFFRYAGNPQPIKKTVYFFIGKVRNKEVTLSHEHRGFIWLPYTKAVKQLTYSNAQELLSAVHRYNTARV